MKCDFILFKDVFGVEPTACTPLAGAGSGRRYTRLCADVSGRKISAILTSGENVKENRAFVALTHDFALAGVNVPAVYLAKEDYSEYLQEDLGDFSLLDLIKKEEKDETVAALKQTVDNLVRMQTLDESVWGDDVMEAPFSHRLVMWDLNYFKYAFLKPSGVAFSEDLLEDDFERLADRLMSYPKSTEGFMMRDCQSRNVMIDRGRTWLIDYQSGRRGPAVYDIVSLLWQTRANLPEDVRREVLHYYVQLYSNVRGCSVEDILSDIEMWCLFRGLQVMGAYGFRGLIERKSTFIESIRSGISNLATLLGDGVMDDYPELKRVVEALVAMPRFKDTSLDGLTITIFSFSYKKGYPEDLSGNGGGFMFDCRAMHNPGRYEEYKALTGLDEPVRRFLEERGEVQRFLHSSSELVFPAVERYLQRGFTSLQVGFGCTGGQHRSVYCASRMAEMVKARFPEAKVVVIHREQGKKSLITNH